MGPVVVVGFGSVPSLKMKQPEHRDEHGRPGG